MVEIERKFLVTSDAFKQDAHSQTKIIQGFLNTHPERTVRVRVLGDLGYITVKGKSNKQGTIRFEWETEIDRSDAEGLIQLCEPGIIEKIRYEVKVGDHLFEVDEFLGDNGGLIVAEIELEREEEAFPRPDWLGIEVTGKLKYYNSKLIVHPYQNWNK